MLEGHSAAPEAAGAFAPVVSLLERLWDETRGELESAGAERERVVAEILAGRDAAL